MGNQIIADAQAYADGINAYNAAHNVNQAPFTVNDVIAVTAFIGSIFGAGGGAEAANSDLLAKLQQQLGADQGAKVWSDVMLADDPEAPTTITKRFDYPVLTGGPVTGSVVLDPGSIQSIDPRQPLAQVALGPPRLRASNFLVTAPSRSASGNTLAVMGPQLGYYYPEIVEQLDLHGPGYTAQGAAVPGLSMYILIGRTPNYAWSLTSAGHDVRDVFVEQLCETDNSPPTRTTSHYLFDGQCRAMDTFTAGTLGSTPLTYHQTVHGNVFATATVGGQPVALTRKRSTFGRDGLNLAALRDMTQGRATTPARFWRTANKFGFTFNWAYAARGVTAYYSSGRLPKRAKGLDRRLPTLGTGAYEWRPSVLSNRKHPHDVTGPNLLDRSAPALHPSSPRGDDQRLAERMRVPGGACARLERHGRAGRPCRRRGLKQRIDTHGADEPFGSVHRVEMFNRFPALAQITDNVGIMNRAATQDVRSPVWPVVSRVLRTATAPSPRDQQILDILDDWVGRDAPRLDADNDTFYDEAGPVIMDAIWRPIATAVMSPVFGPLIGDLDNVRSLGGLEGESYVDKDLRTLLGDPVIGPFNVAYCGLGSLSTCADSLWQAIHDTADTLETQQGQSDPSLWRKAAARTGFIPGLLPITFPTTNRPTFQQVIEFDHLGP